jgi:hypothetical protein
MDRMMGCARLLSRAATLGAATFATLLATGTLGVADAAQAATPTASAASAHITSNGVSESFALPAGVNAVKVGAGSTQVTVTRASGVSPYDYIPCNLSVTNPAYSSGHVQATGTIRCAYPTNLYLEVGVSYNGGAPVAKGQSFTGVYVASVTTTTSATPGYYQAYAVSVLSDGQQYGYIYSSNVYIPQ